MSRVRRDSAAADGYRQRTAMFDENLVKSGGRILGRWLRAEVKSGGLIEVVAEGASAEATAGLAAVLSYFALTTSEMAALKSQLTASRWKNPGQPSGRPRVPFPGPSLPSLCRA